MTRKWWTKATLLAAAAITAAPIPNPIARAQASQPAATQPDAATLGDELIGADTSSDERAVAAAQLAAMRSDPAETALITALTSGNADVETAAARAIAAAGWSDNKFVGPLELLLGHNDTLNKAVSEALSLFPDNADIAQHMISAIGPAPADPRTNSIVRALGAFPQKTVASFLIQHLEDLDEDSNIRHNAAVALADMTGLGENGEDASRWAQWWTGLQNAHDFATELGAERQQKFPDVVQRLIHLREGVEPLLKNLYIQAPPAQQPQILQSYLTNSAPEIRITGAHIVKDEIDIGHLPTTDIRNKLLEMVTDDPSPEVRAASVDTLGEDFHNVPALLNQLAREKSSELKVALLTALSPFQNPTIVTQAISLLDDPSLRVAQAAADLIAEAGPVLRQPNEAALAKQCGDALLKQLKDPARANNPNAEGLRRSVIRALGELGDLDRHQLFEQVLNDNNETDGVKAMAIGALGELAAQEADVANDYLPYVLDSSLPVELRLTAAREMAKAQTTQYVTALVDKLNLHPDPDEEVRRSIWNTVESWFHLMSLDDLSNLADRLKNEQGPAHMGAYAQEADVLRFLSQQLLNSQAPGSQAAAAARLETLANLELNNLNQPDQAAADFKQAGTIYENAGGYLPSSPFVGQAKALLALGVPFDRATGFALQVLGGDPKLNSVAPDVLGAYAEQADTWSKQYGDHTALTNAVSLVDALEKAGLPGKLPANLSYIWDPQLQQARTTAKTNLGQ